MQKEIIRPKDEFELGLRFYHDFLDDFYTTNSGFLVAICSNNRFGMKFLATHYGSELRGNGMTARAHFAFPLIYASDLAEETAVNRLRYIAEEIFPLIGTPYDRYQKRRFADPDPENKDYDTDSSYDSEYDEYMGWSPQKYDPSRVKELTIAEAKHLQYMCVTRGRLKIARWLMDKYNLPTDPGCFLDPRRKIRPRYGAEVTTATDFEPREFFRELVSRLNCRGLKVIHNVLTHDDCPAEVQQKMWDIIRGDDEYLLPIRVAFSKSPEGKWLLKKAYYAKFSCKNAIKLYYAKFCSGGHVQLRC